MTHRSARVLTWGTAIDREPIPPKLKLKTYDRHAIGGEMHMLYLVEIENPSGITHIREYSGNVLWDVVADAEADITYEPSYRVTRVWPIDEAPDEILCQRLSASAPPRTA